jgi:acetolactate synthase-1/2/3 large subunit
MMNIQELAVIGGLRYPIGIFLLNNKGYHSIRQTQRAYFPDNPIGCGIESGLPFPDFQALCNSFGIEYLCSKSESQFQQHLANYSSLQCPFFHEIILDLDQSFQPKLSSKKLEDGSMITSELEDMFPFLGSSVMNQLRKEASSI